MLVYLVCIFEFLPEWDHGRTGAILPSSTKKVQRLLLAIVSQPGPRDS